MPRFAVHLIVCCALLAGCEREPGFRLLETPRALPEVQFLDRQGEPRQLSDFRGRVVLLSVWATWCVPCREEMPALDRLQAQLGGADFQVLPLALEPLGVPAAEAFYRDIGLKHLPLFVDPANQVDLDVDVIPTAILIDRQGREIGRLVGAADWDSEALRGVLRAAIAR